VNEHSVRERASTHEHSGQTTHTPAETTLEFKESILKQLPVNDPPASELNAEAGFILCCHTQSRNCETDAVLFTEWHHFY
jgi:hypothetical protein